MTTVKNHNKIEENKNFGFRNSKVRITNTIKNHNFKENSKVRIMILQMIIMITKERITCKS